MAESMSGNPGDMGGNPEDMGGNPGDVTDNPGKMRYEIREGGEVAGFVSYAREGKVIIFLHTETDSRFRGQGLAGVLVRASLDDARRRGLQVLPYCPFMRSWMAEHPEYTDLVPERQRAEFGL